MKKYITSLTGLGALALARVALAAPQGPPVPMPEGALQTTTDVSGLLIVAVDWIFWALIVFAVAMFLIGGYYYVTSGGEAEKVSKANKTLLYAALAVVVALVAAGIPFVVVSFIGSPLGRGGF